MQFRTGSSSDLNDGIWSCGLAVWLASIIVLGGSNFPAAHIQAYFTLSSVLLIACGLYRLRNGLPSGLASFAALFSAVCMLLVLAQLVPLPFEMWRSLPGREAFLKSYEAVGATPQSLALSLSPSATRYAALSVLPPLAAFLGVLSVPKRLFWVVSAAIFACAMVGFILGIIQKSQGAASGLYFYVDPGTAKYAVGTFGSRSLFATQLFTSVPFLAAFAMSLAKRWSLRPILTFAFTTVYIGLLIAVLAAVGSRAGIALAMLSVLVTFMFIFRPKAQGGAFIGIGKSLILLIAGLLVMAQASMVGIMRLAQTDPLQDLRATITAVSYQAAKAQFPAGSGFGTFVPVYQLYETPDTIVEVYINHAHNEWLELAIEGGAPAIALMAIFVLWLIYALYRAARLAAHDPANAHIKAAGLAVVLMLLHAIVDFPFRTDALLVLFGLSIGFLSLAGMATDRAPQKAHGPSRPTSGTRTPRPTKTRDFTPVNRGFGKPREREAHVATPLDQTVANSPQADANKA
jgi:O-antigen ligase